MGSRAAEESKRGGRGKLRKLLRGARVSMRKGVKRMQLQGRVQGASAYCIRKLKVSIVNMEGYKYIAYGLLRGGREGFERRYGSKGLRSKALSSKGLSRVRKARELV